MKKMAFGAFLFASILTTKAQSVSTFENLSLPTDTFWNGNDMSGGFSSGEAYFVNVYDTAWGGSWSGFAYSSKTDGTTSGFSNQYSAVPGAGVSSSKTYAVGYISSTPTVQLTGSAQGTTVSGVYVTNTTYAHNSMRDGDQFAKQFGGVSGDDPDFFKLTIKGYSGGVLKTDTVDFFLADYRFADNTQDYLVDSWEWVDLSSLGAVDSVTFHLSSSDTGTYGMNTPAYFAIDNFNGTAPSTAISEKGNLEPSISIFPNPTTSFINIEVDVPFEQLVIQNMMGEQVMQINAKQVDVSGLPSGNYMLRVMGHPQYTRRFIKL